MNDKPTPEAERLLNDETPADDVQDAIALLLAKARIPVREDFLTKVMARLPEAPWVSSSSRTWLAGVAAAVALFLGAAWLLSQSSEAPALLSPIAAVGDLLVGAALAGAGFLAASWAGIGAAVRETLDRSVPTVFALGGMVVFLNLVLYRLLRRRRTAARAANSADTKQR